MSHRLAHRLSENHEVVFMSYRPHLSGRLELNGGRLTVYSWRTRARPTGLRDAWHFLRIYLRHRPEIVIAHFVGANLSILVSKLLSGFRVRTYEWYHTQSYMIEFDHGRIDWLRRMRRRLYYRWLVDRVVAVSGMSARDYRRFYGLENGRVILNGIPDRYRGVDVQWDAPVLTVGFLGRLEGVKGVEVLLQMAGCLPADRFKFRVAGDGTCRARLETLSVGNVEYLGLLSYESVIAFIEGCHVIVIPSFADNLVTVGIEAMMLERCVVISRRTGLAAYLEDGVDALIREPEADAFCEALAGLYADRVRLRALSVGGRATFERRFTLQRHLEEVEAMILGKSAQRISKPRITRT